MKHLHARIAILLLAGAALPAVAHHSSAMFDATQLRTFSGTVREFQWTNPHCYLQLVVKNEQGQEEEWSLEMGAPMYLFNQGWRRSTVKPGDRLTVSVAPLRNGEKGGLLMKAASADGRALGRTSEVKP